VAAELTGRGLTVSIELAKGDPAREIVRVADSWKADLIAMSTHGHRFVADLLHGTTVDHVRHVTSIPVLLLKAQPA
jgi:nucleotide-binding universal stress UspA family protein